jgi:hypothetical protein
MEIFPKPIKIPKFVALVFEVQSAIKMENIKTDQPASTASTPMMAIDEIRSEVSELKLLTARKIKACPVIKNRRTNLFEK